MLFVTEEFLFFFLAVFALYWLLPGRWRFGLLLLSSLYFYATWSRPFLVHLLIIVSVNYAVMELWRIYRRAWIFFALQAANVLNLAFFKYFYFLADILARLLFIPGWQAESLRAAMRSSGEEILLPLAISFYTFQVMAYGIDIYRGVYERRHSFWQVLLFKTYFPQLIAGPIMRSSELLPQLESLAEGQAPRPDAAMVRRGLALIFIGLIKKVVIADQLLTLLGPALSGEPGRLSAPDVLLVSLSSLTMLYADFSAYSDLARGFGYLMGIEIPINFKAPFLMRSVSDFWRRWHLTFSRWLRDYIYIPLGGSRVSQGRLYLNFFVTFLLGGLWHGASYNFLAWGAAMGAMIALENALERAGIAEWPSRWPGKILRLATTWAFMLLSSLFFFGKQFAWSAGAIAQVFQPAAWIKASAVDGLGQALASLAAVLFFQWIEEKPESFAWVDRYSRWLLPLAALLVVLLLTQFAGGPKDFFYFQF
ncbi:MAG: hypothetical protein K1X75_08550 [Leptospirales bacterium]|nr:hypothetical protein [Leptospirales bacterium]